MNWFSNILYIGESICDFTCHINVSPDLLLMPLSRSDPSPRVGLNIKLVVSSCRYGMMAYMYYISL